MGTSNRRALLTIVGLLSVVLFAGCAQRKVALKEQEEIGAPRAATLQSLVSTAAGVEVRLDRPSPYTFYKAENPSRGVIEISGALPGTLPSEIVPSDGGRRVRLATERSAGTDIVRIEFPIEPGEEVDLVADAVERGKLSARIVQSPREEKKPADQRETPVTSSPSPEPVVPPPAATAVTAATTPAPLVPASDVAPQPALTGITPSNDGVQILVSGDVSNYNAFRLSKPERLVVDLFSLANLLPSPTAPIARFGLSQARVGKTSDKIRIVFDSEGGEIGPYTLTRNEKGLLLRIDAPPVRMATATPAEAPASPSGEPPSSDIPPPKSQSAAPSTGETPPSDLPARAVRKPLETEAVPSPPPAVMPPPALPAAAETRAPAPAVPLTASPNTIDAIDFTVNDGYSRISVRAGKGCTPSPPLKTRDGLVLTIPGCRMPKHLQRFIDTSAFQSVVLGITPYETKARKKGGDAKLLAKLRADAPSTVSVSGGTILWEIRNTELPPPKETVTRAIPPVETVSPRPESPPETLPLPTAVVDRKEPMEQRKAYTGRRVTLEFSDADIRKIFQLIAEVSNLNFLVADDVTGQISIKLVNVPWDQALDVILETKQLAMKRDGNIVQIMPKSKMVSREEEERQAKEALEKGMELKTVIFDVNYAKIDDVASQFGAIKSKRGTITKDSRTNRIIVKDIQPAIDDMKFLLKNLDLPERQVMIEARIVEASSNFTRDLGVKWNTSYLDGSASRLNINSIDSSFGGVVSTTLPTTTTGGLAMGMSFGKLTSNVQLDMRLSAAATIGQVKVISTPKVLTLNNKKAKISQGQSVPYQTVSAEGTKTEFVEAVLTLEVTPHITSDGSVSMEIKASNNSVGSGTPPPINKKEATTELVLKNGETTVIGGIYIDSDTTTETGVPFLMDIPLLGWLFKSNAKNKTKTELLIFITPKVIS